MGRVGVTDIEIPRNRWGENVLPVLPVATPATVYRILSHSVGGFGGCLSFSGVTDTNGYGRIKIGKKAYSTHRVIWAWFNQAEIPDGMTVDHLCRNKSCCNPAHMDICTPGENSRRAPSVISNLNRLKSHCPKGHPYAGENLIIGKNGGRWCRECRLISQRAFRRRQKEKAA